MGRDEWTSLVMLLAMLVMGTVALVVAYQERARAIEKGAQGAVDPMDAALRTRRSALALVGVGAGLILGSLLASMKLGSHLVAGIGLGFIPALAGLGLLLDYRLQRRELP